MHCLCQIEVLVLATLVLEKRRSGCQFVDMEPITSVHRFASANARVGVGGWVRVWVGGWVRVCVCDVCDASSAGAGGGRPCTRRDILSRSRLPVGS